MNRRVPLAIAAALLVAAAASPAGCNHTEVHAPRATARESLLGSSFDFSSHTRLLTIRGHDVVRDAQLLLGVDDTPLALANLAASELTSGGLALRGTARGASVRIDLVPAGSDLEVTLHVEAPSAAAHPARLRLELAEGTVFASGVGELVDKGTSRAPFVTLQEHAGVSMIGIAGDLAVERFEYPGSAAQRIGLAVESAELDLQRTGATVSLRLCVGNAEQVLTRMFGGAERVFGKVQGARDSSVVYATSDDGVPQARAMVDSSGSFVMAVPKRLTHFFAATKAAGAPGEARNTSPVSVIEPGVPWPLLLDLEPGGTCRIRVLEHGLPLTARIIVRGVAGTRDPWFGPDYRASGAGPVADVKDGVAELELPAGRYKLQATHGPLYSIDEELVRIESGRHLEVTLEPRRVIPGLGSISSDLHVHARPSYDAPVQTEDRVLSLVAAGVDFAVPTEHNVVGDYTSALAITGEAEHLRWVPGVEITTFAPKQGHFGVFPYELGQKVPPYRGTSVAAIFRAAHRDPERVLVIHHPFLGGGMGYFDRVAGLAPERGYFGRQRLDFDAIELLNGYETLDPKRTEETLASWLGLLSAGHHAVGVGSSDSHRILYGWAGYPRTLVQIQAEGMVDLGALETRTWTRALKAGRAQATTGPVVELTVNGEKPGATVQGSALHVHLVVRAAPWVDVTRVDLIVDGQVAESIPIPAVPLRVGPELGTDDEVFARSVRLVRDVELTGSRYALAVARGNEKLEWVLPATALLPIAITNPVWIR